MLKLRGSRQPVAPQRPAASNGAEEESQEDRGNRGVVVEFADELVSSRYLFGL